MIGATVWVLMARKASYYDTEYTESASYNLSSSLTSMI